eukprot:1795912-Pleurochrysis_carterae.AAC.3
MQTLCIVPPSTCCQARVRINYTRARRMYPAPATRRTVAHARTKLSMHAACKLRGRAGSDELVMRMRA